MRSKSFIPGKLEEEIEKFLLLLSPFGNFSQISSSTMTTADHAKLNQ